MWLPVYYHLKMYFVFSLCKGTTLPYKVASRVSVQCGVNYNGQFFHWKISPVFIIREKEDIWLSPMTQVHIHVPLEQKVKWQHKHATKTFDYKTIADWRRTVSWNNWQIQRYCFERAASSICITKRKISSAWKALYDIDDHNDYALLFAAFVCLLFLSIAQICHIVWNIVLLRHMVYRWLCFINYLHIDDIINDYSTTHIHVRMLSVCDMQHFQTASYKFLYSLFLSWSETLCVIL